MAWLGGAPQTQGGGFGPMSGGMPARPGPYSPAGPMPAGPLQAGPLPAGVIKPTIPAAGPAMPATIADFMSPEMEKGNLLKKLSQLQMTKPDAKAKWWSFCKVHGEGNFDANKHDSAFLQTFFEAYELGEVPDEPGCPFPVQAQQAATAPAVIGKGWTPAGAQPQDAGAVQPAQDSGAGQQASSGGPPEKVFVGGLPKSCTEGALWQHFQWYGPVASVDLKYDPEGGFRGFGFVTFQDMQTAEKVLADKEMSFQGKWIDCKVATGPGTGSGKFGKGGKGDKGDKGGKGDKGDKGKGKKGDFGKSAWGGGADWSGGYGGSKGSKDGGKDGGKPKGTGPGNNDESKIFVGAMPKTISQDTVWNYFSQFGEVKTVDLKYDEIGGFRGFGFVTFMSPDSVALACSNTAGNYLDGKWVDVKPAAKGGGKGGGGKDGKASGKDGKGFGKDSKGFGKGDKGGDKGFGKGDKGGKDFKGKGCKGGDKGMGAIGWGGGYGGDWSGGMGGGGGWGK
eukprot:CAMPEP_0204518140 /NCGR_PEP_ID=MMETSP0661-20131031/4041_1 /ASSEMBLY_ACC=CAM_ASM_000606 /TAXON_ID=109239 /ORGANISM="Alexandrium margalefi, Strain AMGDE01CS-322" /LENGTH=505 /DNA_ID=CAMNT_0051523575 /DNA_START=33 /DNA_END=1547 /DNA_ORIENTATION=-